MLFKLQIQKINSIFNKLEGFLIFPCTFILGFKKYHIILPLHTLCV